MKIILNKQNHIIIGIGGISSKIVNSICEKAEIETAFAFDTDISSLLDLEKMPAKNRIQLSSINSIGDLLSNVGNENEWFPNNPLIYNYTLTEGCGLNRPCSMLAFYDALKKGSFNYFEKKLINIIKNAAGFERISISIVTSLFGSTGSGLFLPFSVYLRNIAKGIRDDIDIDIRGFFLLPESFMYLFRDDCIIDKMKAIAYASLQEIHSISTGCFEKMNLFFERFGITDDESEPPFDYCFFYDHMPENNIELFAEMFVKQFLSSASSITDSKLDNAIRIARRKNRCALYASSDMFKFYSDETSQKDFERLLSDIAIENSIVTCFIPINQKDVYQIKNNSVHVEYIEECNNIFVSRIITNISLDKFYYCQKDGEYEKIYTGIFECDGGIATYTPHLTSEWDNLPLISDSNAKKSHNQIFISYSSKEYEIALLAKKALERRGFSCWLAPESIPGGSNYTIEIPLGISNSFALVVLLSKNSQKSIWVQREVQEADDKRKYIIPLLIDDGEISEQFKFVLKFNQHINGFNRLSASFIEVVSALRKFLEKNNDNI